MTLIDIPSIVDWLGQITPNLLVREEDLRKPTFETMKMIYRELIVLIMQIDPQRLEQAPMELVGDSPETFSKAHGTMMMTATLSVILDEHFEITISDLIRPEMKRTQRILSVLLRVLQTKEEKAGFVERLMAERGRRDQELAGKRAQARNLAQVVAAQEADHAARAKALLPLREKKKELLRKKDEQDRKMRDLECESDRVDQEEAASQAKLESLTAEVEQLQSALATLTRRIVSNPEKLRHEIEELELGLERAANERGELETKRACLTKRGHQLREVESTLNSIRKLLDQATELQREVGTLCGEKAEAHDAVSAAAQKMEEVEGSRQRETERLKSLQQSKTNNERLKHKLTGDLEAQLALLNKKMDTSSVGDAEASDLAGQLATARAAVAQMEAKLGDWRAQFASAAEKLRAKREAIARKMDIKLANWEQLVQDCDFD